MSSPTDDDWKRMSKLVDIFYNRPDAEPFRDPVAWKEIGLTDYPVIIKEPMDLGTIKTKLKAKSYPTLFAVAEDVRKVWNNCMTYNADGSDFYKLAESLQKKWDDKYTKVLEQCSVPTDATAGGAGGATDPKVSLADKRNFAKSLFTIEKEELGKVLVEVEQKCPAAIVRNSTEDEIELNVDKLSAPLLKELMEFVNQIKNGGAKKKATSNKKAKLKA
jgi:hypothetical protein